MKHLLSAIILAAFCFAGFAEDTPKKNGNEMPLELYQKLKAHFDTIYGASVGLLPGVEPPNKAETESALRKDAAANKDALIKALGSSAVIHRELAARSLEYCGDKKAAVEALGKVVSEDADETVRRAAAAALAKLPDAASVDSLIKGLSDTADSVRGICATALGNIKDPRAAEPLLTILKNEAKPMVRLQAATALSKIKEKSSLESLTKLLETEKDERVKMAIAGAVRNIMGGNTASTEKVPSAQDAAGELAALAKEMKEVEQKLRDDRHDQAVQVQGGQIEQKLAMLIEKLNKSCSSSSSSSSQQDKQQQQQKQPGQGSQNKQPGGSPLKDSSLGGAVPPGSMNAAIVAGKQDAWAKLPPAQRDELLQAFREEMPERWRKRLEAYFLSVAAEEAKNADK